MSLYSIQLNGNFNSSRKDSIKILLSSLSVLALIVLAIAII